jgi:diguanylate cyclase (GGDEF)-like protein/PAS domain S-box-containing protein
MAGVLRGWRPSAGERTKFHPLSSASGRIILGFGLLVLTLVAVAAGSAWQVQEHRSDTAAMEEHADTAFQLQNAQVNAESAASGVQRYIMVGGEILSAGDEDLLPTLRSNMAEAKDSLARAVADAEARGDMEEAETLREISTEGDSLIAGVEMVIALQQSGDGKGAAAALEMSVVPFRGYEDKLAAAAQDELAEVSKLRNAANTTGQVAFLLLIVSGATGAALGLVASVFIARSIIKPLSSLEQTAVAVSEGDLEARAQAIGPRELAHLGAALNQMTESLLDASKRRELEEALRQSEERLRTVVAGTPIILFALDREGVFTLSEGKGLEALGLEPGQVVGRSVFDVYSDLAGIQEQFKRALAGEPLVGVVEIAGLAFETICTPLRDQDGEPNGVMGVATDVTERRRAEQTLRNNEEEFRLVFESAKDAILWADPETGLITRCNRAAESLLERERDEIVGQPQTAIHPAGKAEYYAEMFERHIRQEGRADEEAEVITKSGRVVPVHIGASLTMVGGKPIIQGIFRDITERKRAEETIKHLAYHDVLTHLPNRTLFKDRLTQALAQAHRKGRMVAVLFLDLDQFKVVNDTVGHAEGDRLLQRVAKRLAGLVREGDTVARVGGDEFVLLLAEAVEVEDAVEVAERILESFKGPWTLQGQEFRVTTSIGIATYPSDGEDAESLLRNADTAMYRAKEHGRDNYQLYTPAMNARIAERLALENSLRHGLERGEFVVYYQPQVNIGSGQVAGVEALVRWEHPERGLVLPAEFIPAAEETGLIVPLGEWVLRTACAQNKAWQEEGLPAMRVAVNLSARQFQQRNLMEVVARALQETGLAPHLLQFEITEGIAMHDVDFTVPMLRRLRAMGVQFAIDDFGTGYSSLAYLKRLPIDAVKIDRSFVSDLTVDADDAAIASTVITMAHSLKLSVIAEGVETEEQLAFLSRRRCDEMQGYLFSRAVPAEEIGKILRAEDALREATGSALDSA